MIIGIMGRAQHGKDTLGKMLADTLYDVTSKKYILMAFATELKRHLQVNFDFTYEQLWGSQKEVPDPRFRKPIRHEDDDQPYWTPREILQNYGEFFRTIDYDFWVKELFNVIDEKEYKNVIITDVRHLNEFYAIKNRKGPVVKIIRNIETGVHNQSHISEIALDKSKPTFTITNYGSLYDLKLRADELVKSILSYYNDPISMKLK